MLSLILNFTIWILLVANQVSYTGYAKYIKVAMVNLHRSVPYFQPLTPLLIKLRSFSFPCLQNWLKINMFLKTLSILLKTSGNKILIFSCPLLTSIHFLLMFLWTKLLICVLKNFSAGRKSTRVFQGINLNAFLSFRLRIHTFFSMAHIMNNAMEWPWDPHLAPPLRTYFYAIGRKFGLKSVPNNLDQYTITDLWMTRFFVFGFGSRT